MDLRADRHAIASCTDKVEQNPVSPTIRDVVEEFDRATEHRYYGIDPPVIVYVAERDPAMRSFFLKVWACISAYILELAVPEIPEHRIWFRIPPFGH